MRRPSSLEGASCADLNPLVIDKFFAPGATPIYRKAARNICARCVVLDDCRLNALRFALTRGFGIVGGMSPEDLKRARACELFENGERDTPPRGERPDWLPRSEATETVEQTWVEVELGVER